MIPSKTSVREPVQAPLPQPAGQRHPRQRGASTIRPAVLEDYDRIATLQARNGLQPPVRKDWVSMWKGNPAYDRWSPQDLGWVVETKGGEIVASISNLRLAYWFRGRRLRVASACGWAADPAYRSYSMTLMSRFLTQPDVDLFLCTTVSRQAESTMQFLQMLPVPSGQWNRSEFWITNFTGFARAALRHKSIPLARLACYPAALALFLHDKLTRSPIRSEAREWQVNQCPAFDERFDEFWDALHAENFETLLGARTQESLRWYFRARTGSGAVRVLGAFQNSRLKAYAIFDREDNPVYGLKRMRLIDAQALPGNAPALAQLMSRMIEQCRRTGLHVLEVPGAWLGRLQGIKMAAPYRRVLPCWTQYYKAADPVLARELDNPAAWAPSSFDGDASMWEAVRWE